ncbi:MAG: hypothetical protein C0475_03415 [Planctomyces sp.]|nr:hypothetical protein [Planctomyces sp.]MBA4039197.1 hypothetical protein [Planctomyces sp.]MBA4119479.1 hypothetical protein [Isosphaera sp.]
MSNVAIAVVAYLLLAVEIAVRQALNPGGTATPVAPYFVLPLVVHVALHASVPQALWTGALCGLMLDLLSRHTPAGGVGPSVVVVGPGALGYLACAYLVLVLRGVLLTWNPLVLVTMSIVGSALAGVVGVALLLVRAAIDPAVGVAARAELSGALLSSLYTGLTALGLWPALRVIAPRIGLGGPAARRFGRPMR